ADEAMANARVLIEAYVAAGFHKIHLDCSMSCADDPTPLPDETVAARSADLARIAERTAAAHGLPPPVYVIGTEVPVPGGEASLAGGLQVTRPDAAAHTLEIHRRAFDVPELAGAWERVIAMVVQPGVDFDHSDVHHYEPQAAAALSDFLERQPRIVFEAHSTDYQTEASLHALVRDHFAILKVGPGLTFALREALWALDAIEREWIPDGQRARLREVALERMRAEPGYWRRYYHGEGEALEIDLQYSLSDRIRYYWPDAAIERARVQLFANLRDRPPPMPLVGQHLPLALRSLRDAAAELDPHALAMAHVDAVLDDYHHACHPDDRP
ncbi:MAG TPA: class II D-tagatose-bisphosphate aldolase, non-catalytic subunit, partial [Xanthomonadaceae bacterium]|nr:class II D-tagatose-bisphosphate aldolase, non-catalytic subunit [Xanthomonadaceae bacterium]